MPRFVLFFLAYLAPLCAQFHVCTVATYEHPNLAKLVRSCQIHHIHLDIIGMHRPFYGTGTKFIYFKEYIDSLDDSDIVMFVDAFDVLIVQDKATILEKFQHMKVPMVMSAETGCWPDANLSHLYPPSPTPFRYINTGAFMGYVGSLKEWLSRLDLDPAGDDQLQATLDFLNTPPPERRFVLDYHSHLFLSLHGVLKDWVKISQKLGKVYSLITQSEPCVIHANGLSFTLWKIIYSRLIR